MDALPEDKKAKINQFKEITLATNDERCIDYLEAFSWNVEDATLAFISGHYIENRSESSFKNVQMPRERTIRSKLFIRGIEPSNQTLTQTQDISENQSLIYSIFAGFFYIVSLPFGAVTWTLYYTYLTFQNLFSSTGAIDQGEEFFNTFKNENFTNLAKGDLPSIISLSSRIRKPILSVTLRDFDETTMNSLKQFLLNEDVHKIINEKYILWGINVSQRCQILSLQQNLQNFPYFEIILPNRTIPMLRTQDSPVTIEQLKEFLSREYIKVKPFISRPIRQLIRSTERELLIKQQEEEFEKSLKKDREKEEKKLLEINDQKAKENEILQKKIAKEHFEQLFVNARKLAAERIASNPSIPESKITLKIKYPTGNFVQFSMSSSDSISLLCDKILVSNQNIKTNFYLFSNPPKKQICFFDVKQNRNLQTLYNCDINQSQVIMLEFEED